MKRLNAAIIFAFIVHSCSQKEQLHYVDKMPVGRGEIMKPFNGYELALKKGDVMYFYSDGFGDQFGGPHGKKYKVKRMQKFLSGIHTLNTNEQKQKLYDEFNEWKREREQIDDVCIVGIKIN
ncbi:MAG TPA: SpoIIE family protein phosphatase [Flavobacteriales bacterium]|nr:SpoIIE family protein phosphatase [Flavobacteriales bacterium]